MPQIKCHSTCNASQHDLILLLHIQSCDLILLTWQKHISIHPLWSSSFLRPSGGITFDWNPSKNATNVISERIHAWYLHKICIHQSGMTRLQGLDGERRWHRRQPRSRGFIPALSPSFYFLISTLSLGLAPIGPDHSLGTTNKGCQRCSAQRRAGRVSWDLQQRSATPSPSLFSGVHQLPSLLPVLSDSLFKAAYPVWWKGRPNNSHSPWKPLVEKMFTFLFRGRCFIGFFQ